MNIRNYIQNLPVTGLEIMVSVSVAVAEMIKSAVFDSQLRKLITWVKIL